MHNHQPAIYGALAVIIAWLVFAAGVPVRRPRPAGTSWLMVVRAHDRRLLKIVTAVSAFVGTALLFRVLGGPAAWFLLAAVAAPAAPVAYDRWRRTNGDLAPLSALLARVEAAAAVATDSGTRRVHGRAAKHIPDELRDALRRLSDPAARRRRICEWLTAGALRTGRDGDVVWISAEAAEATREPAEVTRRGILLELAESHPRLLERVLNDRRPS